MLLGCEVVIDNSLNSLRATAGVPALRRSSLLTPSARASADRMCAAGVATPVANPLTAYGDTFTVAAYELAGSAVLDPAITDSLQRNLDATNRIWAQWKTDPALVDARWDEMASGEVSCADGRLYMSLILRDVPIGLHPERKTWLFMGQDLGAVGGFPADHDQGYVDYLGVPPGVTIYTDLQFPLSLRQRLNVGSGDLCGQCYLDNPTFDGAMIAIGVYMVNDLPGIVAGSRDANIALLGDFIRDTAQPVFLRIGYEFDGSWNGYDPALYIQAFRRIVDRLRAQGVRNFTTVWQGSGSTTNKTTLLRWYPGDDYVDWVGYSYFRQSNPSGGIMTIARERKKPVMIAEATPQRNLSLGDPTTHWNTWFAPFFTHIHANQDMIKAVAYINVRWFDQPAWNAGWGDSRVQIRPEIKTQWMAEMQTSMWAPGNFVNADRNYVLTAHDLTPP